MQRDLCVSCASLPVLGVHLCDRFAMMYDSRVSLSTRASGSFEFPSRWNKHLFPVSAVCYVTSRLKWYRNFLFSFQERKRCFLLAYSYILYSMNEHRFWLNFIFDTFDNLVGKLENNETMSKYNIRLLNLIIKLDCFRDWSNANI